MLTNSNRRVTMRLAGALLAAGALVATDAAFAKNPVKVSGARDIQKQMDRIFSEEISFEDEAEREKGYVEIDKVLSTKDAKKGVAIRSPEFWKHCIVEAWFASKKGRKSERHKQLKTSTFKFETIDGKEADYDMAFHGAAKYSQSAGHKLLFCVLPKGTDPQKYLEENWLVNDTVKNEFIVAAVAETDKFKISSNPRALFYPLHEIRGMFNIDPDRWYVLGEGAAAAPVQSIGCRYIPDRVAGIILHGATESGDLKNAGMTSGLVVGNAEDAGTKAIVEALKAAGSEGYTVVPGGADAMATSTAVVEWMSAHPGRVLPMKHTYQTLITEENTGENWSGLIRIVSPARRGDVTSVTVEYKKDDNVIDIQAENLGEFKVYMNDELLNLDQPVTINVNGEMLVEQKKFERSLRDMLEDSLDLGEFGRLFPASYRGFVPVTIDAPEEGEGETEGEGDGDK